MSQRSRDARQPSEAQAHPWRAALAWGAYLALSTLVMVAALFQMSRIGVVSANAGQAGADQPLGGRGLHHTNDQR